MNNEFPYTTIFADRQNINNETQNMICEKININKKLIDQSFDTFVEAKDAALSIDVLNGNYYALYQALLKKLYFVAQLHIFDFYAKYYIRRSFIKQGLDCAVYSLA